MQFSLASVTSSYAFSLDDPKHKSLNNPKTLYD